MLQSKGTTLTPMASRSPQAWHFDSKCLLLGAPALFCYQGERKPQSGLRSPLLILGHPPFGGCPLAEMRLKSRRIIDRIRHAPTF